MHGHCVSLKLCVGQQQLNCTDSAQQGCNARLHAESFQLGSEELFSAPTSDLCMSLPTASSMSAPQAIRFPASAVPKRFQHTNICDGGLWHMLCIAQHLIYATAPYELQGCQIMGLTGPQKSLTSGWKVAWLQDSTQQR